MTNRKLDIFVLSESRLSYLFIHLEPGHGVFDIVLEAKEPGLPQAYGPTNSIKKVLPFPFHLQRECQRAITRGTTETILARVASQKTHSNICYFFKPPMFTLHISLCYQAQAELASMIIDQH